MKRITKKEFIEAIEQHRQVRLGGNYRGAVELTGIIDAEFLISDIECIEVVDFPEALLMNFYMGKRVEDDYLTMYVGRDDAGYYSCVNELTGSDDGLMAEGDHGFKVYIYLE